MRHHQLTVALAMAALAGALIDESGHGSTPTPEDREAMDKRRREREAEATARYQAEQDAIAAPYREARRLRNLKKLQQGQQS